jgi:toxin FitB
MFPKSVGLEVLGHHQLSAIEKQYFESVFQTLQIVMPDQSIYDQAIALRQMRKIKLGDSLIAATALVHKLELHTRNEGDFLEIHGLTVVNPVQ